MGLCTHGLVPPSSGFLVALDLGGLPIGAAGYSPRLLTGLVATLLVPGRSALISCLGLPCLLVAAPPVAVLMAKER